MRGGKDRIENAAVHPAAFLLACSRSQFELVMAGPDPAIHAFLAAKTWMPGTRPGMTTV
jgi:hypothetical protein